MELRAVLEAVTALDGPLHVMSDSTYVVNCFNDRWYEGWRARGWKNSQRKPVANRDLWEPLIDAYLERAEEIEFSWVKGHSGDPLNEQADALAVAAAEQFVDSSPSGGAAEAAAGATVEVPWDPIRAIWAVGVVDPDEEQLDGLRRAVEGLDPTSDLLVSGLRRGVELDAAEHATRLGVAVAAVLPFVEPARRWPEEDRRRFDAALDRAAHCVVLDGDPTRPGDAVVKRNQWLAGAVLGAIVVGDDALASALSEAGVTVISPG